MSARSEQRTLTDEILALSEGDLGLERMWSSFDGLSRIPRASGNEKQAIEFTRRFVEQRHLEYETDQAGNILFFVPATKGLDKVPGIVFQGHLDMVAQGTPSPAEVGVSPYVFTDAENQTWVRANNTTLGADNGIGVSIMLALADERISHGRLAFLLTNREEIGLVSAREMSLANRLEGYKYLYNLDSEGEGEATISSAGAADTFIDYQGKTIPVKDRTLLTIKLNGLMGGHSGTVIGEDRLNAVKAMAYTLSQLWEKFGYDDVNFVSFESGTARNAIPSEAIATIAVKETDQEEIGKELNNVRSKLLSCSRHEEENNLNFAVNKSKFDTQTMLDFSSTRDLLQLINTLPDGLVEWSKEVPGLPETSTNIGIVRLEAGTDAASIQIMSRSSKIHELESIRQKIKSFGELFDATITQPPAYSGWPPVLDSEINRLTSEAWKQVSGRELEYRYTHGGLECGVLIGRFPHLQAISIGPDIKGAHTVDEKVSVASIKRSYKFLKVIVGKVGSDNTI